MSEVRGIKVIRECKKCGGSFMARTADVKRGWAKFCSKSCKSRNQEKRTHQFANREMRGNYEQRHGLFNGFGFSEEHQRGL